MIAIEDVPVLRFMRRSRAPSLDCCLTRFVYISRAAGGLCKGFFCAPVLLANLLKRPNIATLSFIVAVLRAKNKWGDNLNFINKKRSPTLLWKSVKFIF